MSVELRDRIVSWHRSGEGYQNISAALKVLKNTVASILKCNSREILVENLLQSAQDLRLGGEDNQNNAGVAL